MWFIAGRVLGSLIVSLSTVFVLWYISQRWDRIDFTAAIVVCYVVASLTADLSKPL